MSSRTKCFAVKGKQSTFWMRLDAIDYRVCFCWSSKPGQDRKAFLDPSGMVLRSLSGTEGRAKLAHATGYMLGMPAG